MRYAESNKKGIVKALRGETRERSPYLRALSEVIVATELKTQDKISIRRCLASRAAGGIKKTTGNNTIREKIRIQKAREYSSILCRRFSLVISFPVSSDHDLSSETIIAKSIPAIAVIIFYNTFFLSYRDHPL